MRLPQWRRGRRGRGGKLLGKQGDGDPSPKLPSDGRTRGKRATAYGPLILSELSAADGRILVEKPRRKVGKEKQLGKDPSVEKGRGNSLAHTVQ